jgi:inward rectifier potassium channel
MSHRVKTRISKVRNSTIEVSANHRVDIYHSVVSMSLPGFLALFATFFVLVNAFFGWLYGLKAGSIGGLKDNSYAEYFFFSVQTLATIGYGAKYPQTLYADVLVTIESMIGLLSVGLFAAIAFARFSIPRSRIVFSDKLVIHPHDGVPTLMLRIANERSNQIIDADVSLSLIMREVTAEGMQIRRIHDLQLIRSHTPILSLTWTIFHPIVEGSPFFGHTPQSLAQQEFGLVVTVKGLDETIAQTVHANHVYAPSQLLWAHRFKDIFVQDPNTGRTRIDLTSISEVQAL